VKARHNTLRDQSITTRFGELKLDARGNVTNAEVLGNVSPEEAQELLPGFRVTDDQNQQVEGQDPGPGGKRIWEQSPEERLAADFDTVHDRPENDPQTYTDDPNRSGTNPLKSGTMEAAALAQATTFAAPNVDPNLLYDPNTGQPGGDQAGEVQGSQDQAIQALAKDPKVAGDPAGQQSAEDPRIGPRTTDTGDSVLDPDARIIRPGRITQAGPAVPLTVPVNVHAAVQPPRPAQFVDLTQPEMGFSRQSDPRHPEAGALRPLDPRHSESGNVTTDDPRHPRYVPPADPEEAAEELVNAVRPRRSTSQPSAPLALAKLQKEKFEELKGQDGVKPGKGPSGDAAQKLTRPAKPKPVQEGDHPGAGGDADSRVSEQEPEEGEAQADEEFDPDQDLSGEQPATIGSRPSDEQYGQLIQEQMDGGAKLNADGYIDMETLNSALREKGVAPLTGTKRRAIQDQYAPPRKP
jgi:hypothetical protein